MPTRALKLKLIVPRDERPESIRKRRALYATHAFVNEAVAHYERMLLEMRQGPVCVGRDDRDQDIIEDEGTWRSRLIERLRGRGLEVDAIDEALPHFASLYRTIVPSGGKGSAQTSGGYLGALVDPSSEAFGVVGQKATKWAPILHRLEEPPSDLAETARHVVEANPQLLTSPGNPLAWVKGREATRTRAAVKGYRDDPGGVGWVELLVGDLRKTAEVITSDGYRALGELRRLRALPVLDPLGWGRIEGYESGLIPVERMAFGLAVGHLLSWQSWCEIAKSTWEERRNAVADFEKDHESLYTGQDEAIAAVRAFEAKRSVEFGGEYHIRRKELRGWDVLRPWLVAHPEASGAERTEYVLRLQTKLGRDFGSEALLRWLAHPDQKHIVALAAVTYPVDVVSEIASSNGLKAVLRRTRAVPLFTFADAREHPRYAEFDPPQNSNAPGFTLFMRPGGRLGLGLELLEPLDGESRRLRREGFTFDLAPSGQFKEGRLAGYIGSVASCDAGPPMILRLDAPATPDFLGACHEGALPELAIRSPAGGRPQRVPVASQRLDGRSFVLGDLPAGAAHPAPGDLVELVNGNGVKKGKKPPLQLRLRSQDGLEELSGQAGGSALLFDRRFLEGHGPASLLSGKVGPVYFKIGLDLDGTDVDVVALREKRRAWLSAALQNRERSKGIHPEAGFRVLSVNLNVRVPAAVAVFALEQPRDGAVGEVAGLAVRHERSLLLRLPGDVPSDREREEREEATAEVRAIGASISHLRKLGRLYRQTTVSDRNALLDEIGEPIDTVPTARATMEELVALRDVAFDDEAGWQKRVLFIWERVEVALGRHIDAWQAKRRPRREHALGGKSMWAVEHLERVRRLLVAWHQHHYPKREAPSERDWRMGKPVVSGLLDHIDGLKDDRTKTLADLIVQAARGIVYEGGGWKKKHAPVDLIVLEDLSRYRFHRDRPRRENTQLMRWSHRAVNDAVRMQAALYGIAVADTSTAFSSRMDAVTGAPGIRCYRLSKSELEHTPGWLGRAMDAVGIRRDGLNVGDFIPVEGGDLFVSPRGPDGVRVQHADLNAAENVGRRYLVGHGRAFRLRAAPMQGDRFANLALGDRLAGGLGGIAVLLEASAPDEYELRPFPSSGALAKAVGLLRSDLPESTGDEEDLPQGEDEDPEELAALLESGDEETFFRDPSGLHHGGKWVPAKRFWSIEREMVRRLRAAGRLHG